MSSWVVPSVAAEMWNVAVQTILDRIANGSLKTSDHGGFTFVDIASDHDAAPQIAAPKHSAAPTYPIITPEELAALNADSSAETPAPDVADWRSIRDNVSQSRRKPRLAA